MLKISPSWTNASSPTEEDIIYSLKFLPGDSWNLMSLIHRSQKRKLFFRHKRMCSGINPGFSALQYQLFWEFTSPRNKNQASRKKHTRCGPNAPSCTDRRNHLPKCILATGSFYFKALTTDALHGRSCYNLMVLRAEVFERLLSWSEKKYLRLLPADTYLKYSCTKNTFSRVHQSWVMLLHH